MFAITGLGALIWLPFWLWFAPKDPQQAAGSQAKADRPRAATIINNPAFWAISAAVVFSSYYWYFLLTWVPTMLTQSRGFTTKEMGNVLSAALFGMALLNVGSGFLADRFARRGAVAAVRIRFSSIAYACASAILLLLVVTPKAAVLPILLVSICGIGLGNSSYWALVQYTAPASMAGSAIGYCNTLSQIAGAAAPIITGWLLGPEKNFTIALAVAGICPVIASACLAMTGASRVDEFRHELAHKPVSEDVVKHP